MNLDDFIGFKAVSFTVDRCCRLLVGSLNKAENLTTALIKGYELALERLDQSLADWNVREIACAGVVFDPRRMNAIDREESDSAPEGAVLEVYRTGYEWNGEVFRPAQVKVACAPSMKRAITGKEHE